MTRPTVNRWVIGLFAAVVVGGGWVLAATPAAMPQEPPKYSAWSEPIWLGPVVNWIGKSNMQPYISKNGLSLYFMSGRPGGVGSFDIWISQRASVDDPWGEPFNPGPNVNSTRDEYGPALSPDEHTLYFASDRPGGHVRSTVCSILTVAGGSSLPPGVPIGASSPPSFWVPA